MVYERQSVVNLSFSFRTPSTSSYLLPGLMVRYGERRQKTTNHDNENSSLISLLEFSLSGLAMSSLSGALSRFAPFPLSLNRRWPVYFPLGASTLRYAGLAFSLTHGPPLFHRSAVHRSLYAACFPQFGFGAAISCLSLPVIKGPYISNTPPTNHGWRIVCRKYRPLLF